MRSILTGWRFSYGPFRSTVAGGCGWSGANSWPTEQPPDLWPSDAGHYRNLAAAGAAGTAEALRDASDSAPGNVWANPPLAASLSPACYIQSMLVQQQQQTNKKKNRQEVQWNQSTSSWPYSFPASDFRFPSELNLTVDMRHDAPEHLLFLFFFLSKTKLKQMKKNKKKKKKGKREEEEEKCQKKDQSVHVSKRGSLKRRLRVSLLQRPFLLPFHIFVPRKRKKKKSTRSVFVTYSNIYLNTSSFEGEVLADVID